MLAQSLCWFDSNSLLPIIKKVCMDTNDIINGLNSKVNSLTELVESLQSHNGSLQDQIHKMVTDYGDAWYDGYRAAQKDQKELIENFVSERREEGVDSDLPSTISEIYSEQDVREMSEAAESLYEAKSVGRKFVMESSGYYGIVRLPEELFVDLDPEFVLSKSTDTTKFMCANSKEKEYLESLGVQVVEVCDWYKLVKD